MLDSLRPSKSSKLGRIWEFIKTFSDWIILALGEVLAQIIGDIKPFEQVFSVLDPTISYPKAAHERVSSTMLYVYTFGVPLGVLLVVNLAYGPGNIQRRFKLSNWAILGLGTSVIVAQVFTEFIKFISRPSGFDHDIHYALQFDDMSFPSGHSSMSFAGLTFLSLYLAGRFRLFTPHSSHGKHLYAYVLSVAPLLLASFVTSSRVSDFRHRGSDVLAGASLGILFAFIGYRYYYPWLGSRDAGTPWMVLREEGAFADYKTHSRNGSHTGPLLPTTAVPSQQQSYADDT
ncbi:hypothetical protein FRB91_006342, partial [Serendipita sp. 411]